MSRIIDKIKQKEEEKELYFSFEYFPPRTEDGAMNLFQRFDRMGEGGPLFIDVTWGHGGGDPSDMNRVTSSLSVASTAVNYNGLDTMLHMTCVDAPKDTVRLWLQRAKDQGIRNIMALRGDERPNGPVIPDADKLPYAIDLVRFIKAEFGDYFGIAVAGYPGGHPDAPSYEDDLKYLKEKIDAGGDFIVTQLFFFAHEFQKFVADCRAIGITCPIIPGVMPIQGYESLRHLVKLSRLEVPKEIFDEVEKRKHDDEAIRAYGVQQCTEMLMELINSRSTMGIHFYTLNRELAVVAILKNLTLWSPVPRRDELPWKTTAHGLRAQQETVRPIFWAQRPKSYVSRTQSWNDFPNGRWGDSSSPAFGDLSEYYMFTSKSNEKDRRKMWFREIKSLDDVSSIFIDYLEGRITMLPWVDDTLGAESERLVRQLSNLNKRGLFTINSQPAVNGVPSEDPVFGWGGPHGYIYQKAYVEFFIAEKNMPLLVKALEKYPRMLYHAMSSKSDGKVFTNAQEDHVTAVTWGVFPGKEIVQPTVVDPRAFKVWKDEAYELWNSWVNLYEAESTSRAILEEFVSGSYLVNIVDNNYITGDIFEVFDVYFSLLRRNQ